MLRAHGLGLVLLLAANGVRADERPVRIALAWEAPEGCASSQDIQRRLGSLLQRPVAWTNPGESHRFGIVAVTRATAGSWTTRIRATDTEGHTLGTRDVAARTAQCRELDVPIALVIATLLDGLTDLHTPVEPSHEQPGALGGFVGAAVGFGAGPWPCAGLRAELPGALPLALDASVYAPAELVDAAGRGARYFGAHAGIGICPSLWAAAHGAALLVCAQLQAGAIWARGTALSVQHTQTLPLALGGLEPRLHVPLGSDALSAQLSMLAGWMLVRPRFEWTVSDRRESLQPEPFVLGARISLMGRLP